MTVYLDSSAFVKLVVAEAETTSLRRWLRRHDGRYVSSELLYVETVRALTKIGAKEAAAGRRRLAGVHLVPVDRAVIRSAAGLGPTVLRTLDAIHVATALRVGGTVVTYDDRMREAATANGLPVEAPV